MNENKVVLSKLASKYRKWVSSNPSKCSELESTVKWVSIIISNQFSNSNILSELIFTISNLTTFFNDRIILDSSPPSAIHKRYEDNLKIVLTLLDHCEIFIEITSKKIWGARGKWIVVFFIQLFKTMGRIKLMGTYKLPLIESPPVPFLKRRELAELYKEISKNNDENQVKVLLLSSGKAIRSINSSCDIFNRSWKPVEIQEINPSQDKEFNNYQLIAETIYIMKPLVHLGSMYYYGEKTWKPWIFALSLDLTSLYLMRKPDYKYFSRKQKIEMMKRSLQLLMYLVRSPFYDYKSKRKIEKILLTLTKSIPCAKFVIKPVYEYLPQWQDIYFHMWSS